MRYLALACDYDGTIAHNGRVSDATLAALERLRASGRKLILVTGRELEELLGTFPGVQYFDSVVAENGALLYHPGSRLIQTLAESPPANFIDALKNRNVAPLSVGHVIVATWKPHEIAVLETIRDLGLELQVIFNKDAVMILPAGVNKATGLAAALKDLELSAHEVVGVGDAENDHAFLTKCECGVAVANALPSVKERADLVMTGDHGRGVEQLIDRMIRDDLQDLQGSFGRHRLVLGQSANGAEAGLSPYGSNVFIAGPSGSGKSTVCKSFLERLQEQHYQFCIIDPEGDYDAFEGALTVGNTKHGPTVEDVLQHLKEPGANVVVNLVGLPLADRPLFFLALLPRLHEMRSRTSRPHWIVVDETHHLLPAAWAPAQYAVPPQWERMVFITVHPDLVMPAVLDAVTSVIAVGDEPGKTIEQFCSAVKQDPPRMGAQEVTDGEILFWSRRGKMDPYRVKIIPPRAEHRRHVRKYAEGELPPDRSFYFHGPAGALNLRAQNLILFNQIADGVDDATWLFHLRQGDYSRWFRDGIKDEVLAREAEAIEQMKITTAAEMRELIRELIERYYTLPSSTPLPMPGTDADPAKKKNP